MPAGAGGGRKKPFSGKQKKVQLQAKKNKNLEQDDEEGASVQSRAYGTRHAGVNKNIAGGIGTLNSHDIGTALEGTKFFERRLAPTRMDAGRYALVFRSESREEIHRLKKQASEVFHPVLDEYLECQTEDFYTPELDFPIRPPWNYQSGRTELEQVENRYFHEYLKTIDRKFERKDLSYFELNLETWRQFWRVLEMSDILLCVVDIRYPPLLFPPKLYDYVSEELGKHVILVLNKVDLCPAPLVLAWKIYFKEKYPNLEVLCFTSFPSYNLHENQENTGLMSRRQRGRLRMAAEGAMELYKACEKLVQGQVDLSKWKEKILEEMNATEEDEDGEVKIESIDSSKPETGYYEFTKYNGGILTIGCVGQPNVGKSSLINALMGKKVVSVSKTPGHTKHFQTIFLTPKVRLCDCPGLIFPSKVPKPLQVLCGSYPIAQLREPYSTVKYLGERLDLPRILGITHPEGDNEWSALDIADGWAAKRGYITAKAARLDSYRGANHILRIALEGRICLCLRPPEYDSKKDLWMADPRVAEINHIQAKSENTDKDLPYNRGIEISDEDEPEQEEVDDSGDDGDRSEGEEGDDDKPKESVKKGPKESTKFSLHNKFAMLGDDEDDDDDD